MISASPSGAPDFVQSVYPAFQAAQCEACHNDNGVASGTRLRFPGEGASADEIRQFGLSLARLVNRAEPERSRLLLMPTNRAPHPGGERIRRDSEEERRLVEWIRYLATTEETAKADPAPVKSGPPVLRRLTHAQYDQTVADLLGDMTRPSRAFPAEDFVNGYTNQAEGQSISPLLAEEYAKAAAKLARNAARSGALKQMAPCQPRSAGDPDCAADFVSKVGRRAYRRPLAAGEAKSLTALLTQEAARSGDFWSGAQLTLQAILQSPAFLFHTGTGDYATASRLSYLLWNTMPDPALAELAEGGRLRSPEQIEAAARRLMADPRAQTALSAFVEQWLRLDRVKSAIRERTLFPEFGPELASAMVEETRRMFSHLVWDDLDFRQFFTADYSFLNSGLAALYGVPAPDREFTAVSFPGGKRAGILGQASFLTLTSKPEETSPTERGLFLRERFLCQVVPPPPPGVNTTLPAMMEDRPMSNRERLAIHLSNPSCAACHKLIDSIGFGFEQFDAIGRYREKQVSLVYPAVDKDKKNVRRKGEPVEIPVDTTARIVGVRDSTFTNPAEAGQVLAESPLCQRCVVKQFFRYALGRHETDSDGPAIDRALERFRHSGFHFRELILAVVTSEPFLQDASHAN